MMKERMKGEREGWMGRRRIRREWGGEGGGELLEKELLEGGQMQNDRRLWK